MLFTLSCRKVEQPKPAAPAVPMVEADVYTFSTTSLPDKRNWLSAVVVSGTKARLTDELDRWRLFDLEANSVTFVNDVEKTFRTETLQSLVRQKSIAERQKMPPDLPRVILARGEGVQVVAGRRVLQYVVQAGSFRREMWFSEEPYIHERLFPLITLSEPIGGPYPAAIASLHRSLAGMRGYPLLEKTTVVYGSKQTVVERRLARVDHKPVPLSLVRIPADYRDTTPVTAPAAGRPSAASRPSGRSTREAE